MHKFGPAHRRSLEINQTDLHAWWSRQFATLTATGLGRRDAAEAMFAIAVAQLTDAMSPRSVAAMADELAGDLHERADLADGAVASAFSGRHAADLDEQTIERRNGLLRRLYGPICEVEVEGDPEEAALDLASVLFSFGLSIAEKHLGVGPTADHLARLGRIWARKRTACLSAAANEAPAPARRH